MKEDFFCAVVDRDFCVCVWKWREEGKESTFLAACFQ